MALTAPLLYQSLLLNRFTGAFPFAGLAYDLFALGLANGVAQWAPTIGLAGSASGTDGSGAISVPASRIVVPPDAGVMVAALSGAGMQGPLSFALATSVASGISQGFSTYAQYSGVSLGVGVGVDTSKVIFTNAPALVGILEVSLRSSMGPGLATSMMTIGLGNGIAALLLLGAGTAPIVGATTGSPSVGTTTSVVV